MKPKTVVSAVLLTFVAASLIYLGIGQGSRGPAVVAGSAESDGSVESAGCAESAEKAESAGKAGCAGCPDAAGCAGSGEVAASAGAPDRTEARVVAYYFHGTRRCTTCLAIENTARESLQRELANEFESGAMEWRTVDFEEAGNEHFAQEFELTGAALVLVKQSDGKIERWGNLERVWELVGDAAEFSAYVTAEARGYLEES